jgi:hypothetical protein
MLIPPTHHDDMHLHFCERVSHHGAHLNSDTGMSPLRQRAHPRVLRAEQLAFQAGTALSVKTGTIEDRGEPLPTHRTQCSPSRGSTSPAVAQDMSRGLRRVASGRATSYTWRRWTPLILNMVCIRRRGRLLQRLASTLRSSHTLPWHGACMWCMGAVGRLASLSCTRR